MMEASTLGPVKVDLRMVMTLKALFDTGQVSKAAGGRARGR